MGYIYKPLDICGECVPSGGKGTANAKTWRQDLAWPVLEKTRSLKWKAGEVKGSEVRGIPEAKSHKT